MIWEKLTRKNKILAVVKSNGEETYVLKNPVKLEYTKYGDIIIGTDGLFVSVYYYEAPIGRFKAFAGRKFDLQLTDGTVEHCCGQWWDGRYYKAEEILGSKIISASAHDINSLKKCYVFIGYLGIEKAIEKLRGRYRGKIYDYWEYEGHITANIFRKKSASEKYDSVKFTKKDMLKYEQGGCYERKI